MLNQVAVNQFLWNQLPSKGAKGLCCGMDCDGANPGGAVWAAGIGGLLCGNDWCGAEPTGALLITGCDDCSYTD